MAHGVRRDDYGGQHVLGALTLLVALNDVLQVVDGDRVERRQVDLPVDGQEGVDLPLVPVLGRKGVDVDKLRLHLEVDLLDLFNLAWRHAILVRLGLLEDLDRRKEFLVSANRDYRGLNDRRRGNLRRTNHLNYGGAQSQRP